ncbi:hypothetical protein MLD38_016096 [Melastoma candidum]|uniref:Uncharacterized protein n=1 Tax=Melastoma candidum TaxID=119954 RepID=A0ACB9RIF5_9MYRT|nr:hypothetical protein MLD38_016096 [Melastoma candidum]
MSTVTNIGITLTAVFAVSLGVLAAQISWVLWRRSKSLREDEAGGCGQWDVESGGYQVEPAKATKDSCCSCCCRKGGHSPSTKVEPEGGHGHPGATMGDDSEEDFDEVINYWRKMCRESRILCTIKEEDENEDEEGASDRNGGTKTLESEEKKERKLCMREWLEMKQESLDRETAFIIMSALRTELMRLSTPRGSPDQNFAPSPSSPRAVDDTDKNCA